MSNATFEHQHDKLVRVFDQFLREHPSLLDEIPNHAVLIFQIEGDEAFNGWSEQTARRVASPAQPLFQVTFTLKSAATARIALKSIEKLQLEPVGTSGHV